MPADKRRLIYSIVQFLNKELNSDEISEDAKESLEVASQCLQTAYCMAPEDTHLEVSKSLEELFHSATQSEPVSKQAIFGKKRPNTASKIFKIKFIKLF